ncbi:MAG: alpha/beta hydrolase [Verrucomicrobiota bacterium]
MPWRRVLRVGLLGLAGLILVPASGLGLGWWYYHPPFERTHGIVYGERRGRPLVLDMVRPEKPNGLGVALMVSGSWKSGTHSFQPWMVAPLLRRGYTVFAVCHVSQPEATIMEIVQDMHRGVRWVRAHAREYGIDPARIGVTGGSAGGHLSLMLATRGGPGPAAAADPVDRESSAVQAVAIFYPVTDLLNLGPSTENLGDGGPPRSFVKGFGPGATNPAQWRQIGRDTSPIYWLHSNLPPTLIYHGDADTLVPLEQSQRFQQQARAMGATVELVVHPGGQHGWLTMVWDIIRFADWFDRHLRSASGPGR